MSAENKDERAVHYIDVHLRETMMRTIDHYMKSLVAFRHHQSLISMQNFEKSIHQYLIDSIRKSIKTGKTTDQLATKVLNCFPSEIDLHQKIVQVFAERNDLIPIEVINLIKTQLGDVSHSHFVYLGKKIDDLKKMLSRFEEMEKVLPEFNRLFEKCLSQKYDHLPEQEVFSKDGLM